MKKTSFFVLVGLALLSACLFPFGPSQARDTLLNQVFLQEGPGNFSPQSGQLKPIPLMIQNTKSARANFDSFELFQPVADDMVDQDGKLSKVLSAKVLLDLNRAVIETLREDDDGAITLFLPNGKGGTIELELVRVDIFAPGFSVQTSSPSSEPPVESLGIHYQGIVKGDDYSLAAISVFANEVMGFYSTGADGNTILGRLGGDNPTNKHVLYAERDLKVSSNFVCDTKDDPATLPVSVRQEPNDATATCVRIYIEANNDLLQDRGSVANTTSFITGFFNQSAALYRNEGVPVSISEIFVWTSPSPYTGTDSLQQLQQFKAFRTSFNGNLAHLLSLQSSFGGIAYRPGLCNSGFSYAFSGIDPVYQNVPTYSWTVGVFTHETGHNLGSRHTHACAWNGDNTAIDGCAPPEGSCSQPGLPPGGGTIMSYCHNANGINFSFGFGPQPNAVIVNTFNTALCLSNCGSANAKTVGVFRPFNGIVYLKNSNSGGFADINFVYGVAGDQAIAGDWNGDGVDTLGIYRNGTFYLRNSNTTGAADIVFAFGTSSDLPVAGDWDGNGTDTVGVYRPSTGVFYLRNSNSAGAADISFVLGNPGDIGIAGDWNGDGTTTTGVFRPSNGIVYLKNTNASGFADIFLVYGNAGDQPLAGDWNGDGVSSVGIYRNGVFYLRNSNTQGFADLVFALGNNGDLPISGDWDGLP